MLEIKMVAGERGLRYAFWEQSLEKVVSEMRGLHTGPSSGLCALEHPSSGGPSAYLLLML